RPRAPPPGAAGRRSCARRRRDAPRGMTGPVATASTHRGPRRRSGGRPRPACGRDGGSPAPSHRARAEREIRAQAAACPGTMARRDRQRPDPAGRDRPAVGRPRPAARPPQAETGPRSGDPGRRSGRRRRGGGRRPGGPRRDTWTPPSPELLERRRAAVPAIRYPEELPVSARRDDIAAAIRDHQVVVVAGETGSGKTTQIPKICLELGYGVEGTIGHTQPRRIAARTVAERIAEELQVPLGSAVGYQVRFTD